MSRHPWNVKCLKHLKCFMCCRFSQTEMYIWNIPFFCKYVYYLFWNIDILVGCFIVSLWWGETLLAETPRFDMKRFVCGDAANASRTVVCTEEKRVGGAGGGGEHFNCLFLLNLFYLLLMQVLLSCLTGNFYFFQVVAITVFFVLSTVFYTFLSPFLGHPLIEYVASGIFSPVVCPSIK